LKARRRSVTPGFSWSIGCNADASSVNAGLNDP
jgi:hypothetical protein